MGLTAADWVLFFVYVAIIVYVGWRTGKAQKNTNQFFLAPSGLSPFIIGTSLFATLLSTISYLSLPGETINKGPMHLTRLFAYPLVFIVVGYWLLPKLIAVKNVSIYERVEERLGLRMRLIAATMFILLRVFWMCLLINLTSNALLIMMGIDLNYLPLLMIAITIVALIYTSLGGIQAVMITDVLQTLLLLVGGVAVILIVSLEGHGFSWFPTRWQPEIWDSQPIFSANLSTRVTFFGTVLTTFIWYMATQIGDQVSVQRFMASKDIYSARTSLAINLCLSGLVAIILTLVGFSLLGHFQINPSELRDGLSLERDADQIFPYFISFHLPPLVSGLVLCGLFSAAMSSIDSGVNSISAVVLTDFIKRLKGAFPAKMSLSYARWISAAVGVAVVLFGNLIELVPGNIMEVTNKTVNLLTIPIFIVVAYSIFLRAYNASSVLIGTLSSIVAGVLCAFSGPIFGYDSKTGLDPISFQYIGPISLVVGLIFTHGSGVLFRLARKST